MSNIATKLTYLNGTKQAIKQAINEDFEVIDDNTTFREYADEISSNNAKYKDLIPKETKNATNTLDISNSSGLDKALVTQYGNTYQETNANVFDGTLAQTTYTGTGAVAENNITRFNFINGYTYTINIKFTSNNVSTINQNRILGIRTYKDIGYTGRGAIINSDNLSSGTGSITFTAEENYNSFSFINYADFQSGTITITDFEIITNTPSPDYPQEIVNISGKSTLKDVGKNLFDKDNALTLPAYIGANSGTITSSDGDKCLYIPCKPNTQYTISKISSLRFRAGFTDDIPVLTSVCNSYSGNKDTETSITLSSSTNSNYLIVFYWTLSDTSTEQQILDSIQIEENSTASTYETYQEQSFDLDLKSKNLFDLTTIRNTINGSISNNTIISNAISTSYGGVSANITGTTLSPGTYYLSLKVKIDSGSASVLNKITLVGINNDEVTEIEKPIISSSYQIYVIQITINETKTITNIGVQLGYTNTNAVVSYKDIMISKYSDTTYEPFYDISLCKIDTYKDKIKKSTGKNLFKKNNANILHVYVNSSTNTITGTSLENGIFYIPCKPNTTYTVSKTRLFGEDRFCVFDTANIPKIGDTILSFVGTRVGYDGSTSLTITTKKDANYLSVFVKASETSPASSLEEIANTIQIEENPTPTEYEPFGKVQYLQKKTNKIILNGSESWTVQQAYTGYYRYMAVLINDYAEGSSSSISVAGMNTHFTQRINQPHGGYEYLYLQQTINGTLNCYIQTKNLSTLNDFKNWLSNNNVTVEHPLATPTTIEITESNYPTLYNQLNNIKLFEGVNHLTFTNESGLDVEFDIEYYKDWKLD